MGHLNAELMGTPVFQATFQCGMCAIALVYAVMGDRRTAAFNHRHAHPSAAVTTDRRIHAAAGHHRAHYNGEILPMYRAPGQLLDQTGVSTLAARNHHQDRKSTRLNSSH